MVTENANTKTIPYSGVVSMKLQETETQEDTPEIQKLIVTDTVLYYALQRLQIELKYSFQLLQRYKGTAKTIELIDEIIRFQRLIRKKMLGKSVTQKLEKLIAKYK